MRLFTSLLFLTLVGTFSRVLAAPSVGHGRPLLKTTPENSRPANQEPPAEWTESVDISRPPGQQDVTAPRTRQVVASRIPRKDLSWQVNVGYLSGSFTQKDLAESATFIGGMAVWRHRKDAAWDFNLDLTTSPWIRYGVGRRTDLDVAIQGLPYWRLGVIQTVPSGKLLSGFVDLEKVKAMGAVGFADLGDRNQAFNAEFGAGWGMTGLALQIQLGWNFDL